MKEENKKRRFACGDLHGNYRGLLQCLQRSGFDHANDQLIFLGDICDGYSEVYDCVDELLRIKNLIYVIGNHDEPFLDWLETGFHPWKWKQGGLGTLKSYGYKCLGSDWNKFQFIHAHQEDEVLANLQPKHIPQSHKDFFKNHVRYYIDEQNNCFIHGGFNRHFPIKEQNADFFTWDRGLWLEALGESTITTPINKKEFRIKDGFKEVFIGHTATINWNTTEPMHKANIWNLDTGAGFDGKVTIMNIDTKEYFQSDIAEELYPDDLGRRRKK